ncbi:hypothetical protein SPLC1_S531760 [Arthrospira platensis C1]|nr:hypothetical protein SPLC1_S531760 [Arthrospira platensis C1]
MIEAIDFFAKNFLEPSGNPVRHFCRCQRSTWPVTASAIRNKPQGITNLLALLKRRQLAIPSTQAITNLKNVVFVTARVSGV